MLSKLKALWTIAKTQLADIWNKSKMYIFAAAAIVAALEFRQLKEWFIAYSGQKEINKDKKEDSVLAATENKDNAQADALIQQAKDLPSQQPPVTSDWYKDQK
jgi:hypothetical protein